MRHLGIDYGTKRIGLAISDQAGEFAMPLSVIPSGKSAHVEVVRLAKEKGIEKIVIGDSKDFKGKDNPVMEKIREFKILLENESGLPVVFEPELMTSVEARHIQGGGEMLDASAAALILKSYLERTHI